jgi:hypothetical protein
MNLPDRVFAVGGAGKEIALTMLRADWILEQVIEPRSKPDSLTVTILDTAQGETVEDSDRIREIRQRRDELQEEYRESHDGQVGSVTIDYQLITENIQLDSHIDLLGNSEVEHITNGVGMDPEDWWINESHINENLDFARGVVRKRGLGKAIYYKAFAEDDSLSSVIDLPQKGRIAVITGLGGGTGSGILFDLATHLQDRQPAAEVTLFGVMPTHRESEKVSTNAYTALSELEYLAVEGEQPFKNNILIPIDPTGYQGKTGNQIDTSGELQEFDEAIIYLIASYYSTDRMEDPFTGTPKFAPFTIGIPQVLRYNVEAINEGRQTVREALEDRQKAAEIESEIYTDLQRFLNQYANSESNNTLNDPDQADLTTRLDEIEELLDFDLFTELDYYTRDVFRNQLESADAEAASIDEKLDIIHNGLQAVSFEHSDEFTDEIDRRLAQILQRDLELLQRRKDILLQKQEVMRSDVQDTITYLMGADDGTITPGVKLQQMQTTCDDVEQRLQNRRDDLEEAETELEERRKEYANEIDRRVDDFVRTVETDVERLRRLNELSVSQLLDDLERQLTAVTDDVENANTVDEVESVTTQPVDETLTDLVDELDNVGIEVQDTRRTIDQSLNALKKARTADIRSQQEEEWYESVAPWESSTEEEREEAFKEYRMQKGRLDDSGVFSLSEGDRFQAAVEFKSRDIESEVETQRQELVDNIRGAVLEHIEDETRPEVDELTRALDTDPRIENLQEIARGAIREEVGETEELESRIEEIESEIEDLEEQNEVYDEAIDLFQSLNQRCERLADLRNSFRSNLEEQSLRPTKSVQTGDEEYAYVKNIQPNDVFSTTGEANLGASDLLEREQTRVRQEIRELAENARNEQYTGLYRRTFSHEQDRYQETKIRAAVASQGVNKLTPETLNVEDIFQEAFTIRDGALAESRGYSSWRVDSGGSWDIGLSVFIGGVFLDNIRKMVQPDGYQSGYDSRKERPDADILVHHSHGLEEGKYVRRKELLNLASDEDASFFLRDEAEVVDDLSEEYIEVNDVSQGDEDGESS